MVRGALLLPVAAFAFNALSAGVEAEESAGAQSAVIKAETLFVRLQNGGTVGPSSAPTACRKPVVPSALPASQVQHLGVHTVGQTVSFLVPPRTGTISIIEQAVGDVPDTITLNFPSFSFALHNSAVVTLLTDPNGHVLYDDNAPLPADLTTAHVVADNVAAITGVVTLPNTSQAFIDSRSGGYPAGTWSVQVNDYALECVGLPSFCSGGRTDDRYDLTVLTKPAHSSANSLNVGIYLASEALTAPQAIDDPHFQRFVRTLAMLYVRAAITVGTVTVYDLPPWAKARYATGVDATDLGPCSAFGQLFTLSKPGNELPLFFVDAIEVAGTGFQVVGIDGSIPGPASLGGTVVSGAVVNVADLAAGTCGGNIDFGQCGADVVAYISAHEGGHYMGLYHTTEAFGEAFDPLQDTPTCACSTACLSPGNASLCASFNLVLTADVCTQTAKSPCGGGDNLMFWLIQPPISKGTTSPEQGKVMRANPVVH